jgi:kynurenine formamidase
MTSAAALELVRLAALGRGMIATENLTNLGELPTRGALFMLLPHKFEAASGGLGRAI